MLKYKEDEDNLKEYILENNDNLQKMAQDSHNAAVALLNHKLPELIDNKKGDFRMGKNALQAIYDDGKIEGNTLHKIFQITKKSKRANPWQRLLTKLKKTKMISYLFIH